MATTDKTYDAVERAEATMIPLLETPLNPANLRCAHVGQGKVQLQSDAMELDQRTESENDEQSIYDGLMEFVDEQRAGAATQSGVDESASESENTKSEPKNECLNRIRECIEYTSMFLTKRPNQNPPVSTNIITSVENPPSLSCKLLRKAARAGVAQLAWSSDREEAYTIGVPPGVVQTGWGGHWWVGLSPAQIRAGPDADEFLVRRAEGDLRRKAKRQQQSSMNTKGRLNMELRKTEEGVRRQEQGLHMCEFGDEGDGVGIIEVEDVETIPS